MPTGPRTTLIRVGSQFNAIWIWLSCNSLVVVLVVVALEVVLLPELCLALLFQSHTPRFMTVTDEQASDLDVYTSYIHVLAY